jgi:hypothetical protein
MSVTSIDKDTEQLTMTVTAAYDVSADRAWELWADPRRLAIGMEEGIREALGQIDAILVGAPAR